MNGAGTAAVALGAALLAKSTGPGAPTDRGAWVREVRDALALEVPSLTSDARALAVAHAALESGWGTARAARRGFNIWNITAGSAWGGDSWVDVGGDTDGAGNRITQAWRIYASLQDAARDYWSFLGPAQNRGRYVAARAALAWADLPRLCTELYAAGYFTLAPATYTARLTAVRADVRAFI